MYKTLISSADLAAHLAASSQAGSATAAPDWLIVDCRFDLANPAAGEIAYAVGHIPQAVYAHLERDLAAPITAQSGRHPLPSPQHFSATLSRWGLTPGMQVIAYDADTGAFAARLWWMLRWIGHPAVAVLDGGFTAWTDGGYPISTDVPQRTATQVRVRIDPTLAVTTQEFADLVQRDEWRVLDARAPERFSGSVEPIDRVAGHVPGARNHPFAANLVERTISTRGRTATAPAAFAAGCRHRTHDRDVRLGRHRLPSAAGPGTCRHAGRALVSRLMERVDSRPAATGRQRRVIRDSGLESPRMGVAR